MRFIGVLALMMAVLTLISPTPGFARQSFGVEKGGDDGTETPPADSPPPADEPPPADAPPPTENPPAAEPPADKPADNNDGGGSGDPSNIDLNKLKGKFKKGDLDKAMDLLNKGSGGKNTGSSGSGASSKTPDKAGTSGSGGEAATADSSTDVKLDESDRQYCEVHMKNATRNYRKKQYDRALDEVNQVLGVDRNHEGAHFMKAVLEAKRKSYLDAWREVEISRKTLENDAKFKDFVARLQKVSPKPDTILAAGGSASRAAPTHVSELVVDTLEDFFCDKEISGKVSAFGSGEFSEADGKVTVPIHFTAQAALDGLAMEKKFKELLKKNDIADFKASDGNKKVELKLVFSGLPKSNPGLQAVKSVAEFLKEPSEEFDVKIEKSEEVDSGTSKVLMGTYTLMGRGIADINNFLRRVSSSADHYFIDSLEYKSLNGQTVLRGTVKIFIKTE